MFLLPPCSKHTEQTASISRIDTSSSNILTEQWSVSQRLVQLLEGEIPLQLEDKLFANNFSFVKWAYPVLHLSVTGPAQLTWSSQARIRGADEEQIGCVYTWWRQICLSGRPEAAATPSHLPCSAFYLKNSGMLCDWDGRTEGVSGCWQIPFLHDTFLKPFGIRALVKGLPSPPAFKRGGLQHWSEHIVAHSKWFFLLLGFVCLVSCADWLWLFHLWFYIEQHTAVCT